MLFNSYEFIFVFLPVTLAGFFLLGRVGRSRGRRGRGGRLAVGWLVLASLVYYGRWEPKYLILIGLSIALNYALGNVLASRSLEANRPRVRTWLLALGVTLNLGALGFFKYADFAIGTLNALTDAGLGTLGIVLPLAISFFTFQQIAYLVDAYRRKAEEHDFVDYCLFVTFFPQLIAGPIVHHQEMLPQFADGQTFRPRSSHISVGVSMFAFGLFKKVMIADQLAPFATGVFGGSEVAVAEGLPGPGIAAAWIGALAYTLQLYFDFSGYSDMALGLARMFGVRLPLNFDSPYKARNIVEFWRRWHMTLSRFLRDYLYIPLGGNRKGKSRRYANLMVTMLLGGLWHGAAWTFVAWGGLHGLYLCINHAWRRVRFGKNEAGTAGLAERTLGWAITLLGVIVGWVFFRAESFESAWSVLRGMSGLTPDAETWVPWRVGDPTRAWIVIGIAGAIALWAPNTAELFSREKPSVDWDGRDEPKGIAWRAGGVRGIIWSVVIAAMLVTSILHLMDVSEFLYWQF